MGFVRPLLNPINFATQGSVMRPPSAKLCCHPVQRNVATFGDHQRVCKSHPRRRRAVGLGRCPVRTQGSKVRFADYPGNNGITDDKRVFYKQVTPHRGLNDDGLLIPAGDEPDPRPQLASGRRRLSRSNLALG